MLISHFDKLLNFAHHFNVNDCGLARGKVLKCGTVFTLKQLWTRKVEGTDRLIHINIIGLQVGQSRC